MLEESLNCLSVLSTENNISKWLSWEEATKEYAAKKCMEKKKYYRCMKSSYLINKCMLFLYMLLCLWYLSALLNR